MGGGGCSLKSEDLGRSPAEGCLGRDLSKDCFSSFSQTQFWGLLFAYSKTLAGELVSFWSRYAVSKLCLLPSPHNFLRGKEQGEDVIYPSHFEGRAARV